ncbi:MAG: plastocyanin/azurin family copper-binding protein, partial [Nitrosopumilaceae archaeon]
PASIARGGAVEISAPVVATGKEIPVTLNFIESSDFRTLAFNALPGEPDHNPTITAAVGDKIIFNVKNTGKSFHAFGVTQEAEGFGEIIPGSDIQSASNPLKPGQGGESEFIPGKEGVYYYICTVPGHREQGMQGKIVVGDVSDETENMETEPVIGSAMPAPGTEDVPEMIVKEEPEQTMKEESKVMTPFTGTISIPSGASAPGCDTTNECFIPAEVTINVGVTVTWSNDDSAAHTVTSGTPTGGPDGIFDSSLFMAGTTFSHTFDNAGEYNYFCMVHPWMTGKIKVN